LLFQCLPTIIMELKIIHDPNTIKYLHISDNLMYFPFSICSILILGTKYILNKLHLTPNNYNNY
jgi:hypothetical protein